MRSKNNIRTGRVSSIDYERGTYEVTYFDRGQSVSRQINAMSNGEYRMPEIGQMVSVVHTSNGSAAATTTGTIWNNSNKPAEGYKGLYRKEYSNTGGKAYEKYDDNTGEYIQCIPEKAGRNCNGDICDEAKKGMSITAAKQVQITSSGSSVSIQGKEGIGIGSDGSVSIESGTAMSLDSGGDMNVEADGELDVTAQKAVLSFPGGITINVGSATITIDSDGNVTISAPNITATGTDGDVTVKGVSLVTHRHGGGSVPDR